jgi:hypothetical protein
MVKMNSYLLVNKSTNIVENIVVWDGGDGWSPPDECFALLTDITPAKVWIFDEASWDYIESIEMGIGAIGFTWDGVNLLTNQLKPEKPIKAEQKTQPESIGIQDL